MGMTYANARAFSMLFSVIESPSTYQKLESLLSSTSFPKNVTDMNHENGIEILRTRQIDQNNEIEFLDKKNKFKGTLHLFTPHIYNVLLHNALFLLTQPFPNIRKCNNVNEPSSEPNIISFTPIDRRLYLNMRLYEQLPLYLYNLSALLGQTQNIRLRK